MANKVNTSNMILTAGLALTVITGAIALNQKQIEVDEYANVVKKEQSRIIELEGLLFERNNSIMIMQDEKEKLQEQNDSYIVNINNLKESLNNANAKVKKIEQQNNDLKKKVETYKNRSESPSVSSKQTEVPSRGETKARELNMVATAYTSDCAGCIGITKTGVDVRSTVSHQGLSIIAVDPDIIPLHSMVKVKTKDKTFYALAEDIGSDIKNNRIDILTKSNKEALSFGRQKVEVTILRNGKKKSE